MARVLRQFRVLPSGCQTWHAGVLAAGGGHVAYCSTLAIYVYNAETFALEHLLTGGHERTIVGAPCPLPPGV
jgi:hypothetical protein